MIQFQSGGTRARARRQRLLLCGAGWLAAGIAQPAAGDVTDDTIIAVAAMSDLSAILTAPAFVTVGEQINVSLRVSNAGPEQADVVSVRVELGAGLTIANLTLSGGSNTPSQDASGTCIITANVVSCQLPELPPGGSFTFDMVTAATTAAGSFGHIALVEGSGRDLSLANNSASAATTVTDLAQRVETSLGSSGGGGGGSTSLFMLVPLLLLSRLRAGVNKI